MDSAIFTKQQVIKKLEAALGGKSQAAFAAELGMKQQELNDTLRGKRLIPQKALKYLGLEDIGRAYREKVKR